ncbi:hypothetical protein [Pararcticibacter amylolyticus]|nr:hypothetical protein [Pararcticibacter amylolyticus]
MSKDQKQYLWQTDSLDAGAANPIEKGVLLDHPPRIWYYMLVKNGYYYYVDPKTEYFIRGRIEDSRFERLDSVHLKGFSYPDNALFINADTVFLVNHSVGRNPKRYAKVNVRDMSVVTDQLPLPPPRALFDNMSVGFELWRGNQLWMGYTYHFNNEERGYGSSDTVYIARMSYPEMKLLNIEKDPRSTYPGNVNTAQQNTFVDEKGDFYFLSCPGIARGANPDQPTAIYRIKANEQQLDRAWFFNISQSPIQNHAYGLWYLGNHKALVRSERKDLFRTYEEHYLLAHIEYHEVNLLTREVHKLNLPLDRGSSRTCVLIRNERAYITINDGKGNNDVWIYRPQDRSLTKGLHLEGNIDYIFRLEKLYD